MKGLGLGLTGLVTTYKAHSLQVCFAAYNNNKFSDNIVTGFTAILQ